MLLPSYSLPLTESLPRTELWRDIVLRLPLKLVKEESRIGPLSFSLAVVRGYHSSRVLQFFLLQNLDTLYLFSLPVKICCTIFLRHLIFVYINQNSPPKGYFLYHNFLHPHSTGTPSSNPCFHHPLSKFLFSLALHSH